MQGDLGPFNQVTQSTNYKEIDNKLGCISIYILVP